MRSLWYGARRSGAVVRAILTLPFLIYGALHEISAIQSSLRHLEREGSISAMHAQDISMWAAGTMDYTKMTVGVLRDISNQLQRVENQLAATVEEQRKLVSSVTIKQEQEHVPCPSPTPRNRFLLPRSLLARE